MWEEKRSHNEGAFGLVKCSGVFSADPELFCEEIVQRDYINKSILKHIRGWDTFPKMKDKIDCYDSVQTSFCKAASELAGDKPLKLVNITNAKEAAEGKEIGNADYVINARELYRIFLRTGGAPHKRAAQAFDKSWKDGQLPYKELLGAEGWNLEKEPEEVAIIVDGKPYKCAVAHNLGQVRRLLEGDYRNYDVVRLMA